MGNNLILKLEQLNLTYLEVKDRMREVEKNASYDVSKQLEDIVLYKSIDYSHVISIDKIPTSIRALVIPIYEKYTDIFEKIKSDVVNQYEQELSVALDNVKTVLDDYKKQIKKISNELVFAPSHMPEDSFNTKCQNQAKKLQPIIETVHAIKEKIAYMGNFVVKPENFEEMILVFGKEDKRVKWQLDSFFEELKGIAEKETMNAEESIQKRENLLSEKKAEHEQEIETIIFEAKRIILEIESSAPSIGKSDTYKTNVGLPQQISIANYYDEYHNELVDYITDKKGIQSNYLTLDMKNAGNIMLNVSEDGSDKVDNFIVSYAIKCLEEFPLGALKVHIIDSRLNPLIMSLKNSFAVKNASELCDSIITLHSGFDIIDRLSSTNCREIYKKLVGGFSDLYDLYKEDDVDAFNLVIIRTRYASLLNSGYSDVLNLISDLIENSGAGHKTGVRFLIVNESAGEIQTCHKKVAEKIEKSCECKMEFSSNKVTINQKGVAPIAINGDATKFIELRCKELAKALVGKDKKNITYESVGFGNRDRTEDIGSIIKIPVGISGKDIVELPLSCADTESSAEGQCIGVMTIGASGSGKSSFFHSIVLNGCMKYSPDEIQFWLLDFKFGGASSKYINASIPHIRIISENNKIDDAFCLFSMAYDEMNRRMALFNKHPIEPNLAEYNKYLVSNGINEPKLPRIIILIDEVQEIFQGDNCEEIKKQITAMSNLMRATGMHFIMVAQDLTKHKSYLLIESFMNSASGRVCFRVDEKALSDSGFPEEFRERKREIASLRTGEIYMGYGFGRNVASTIKKVKMAYASAEEFNNYFMKIREKYSGYDSKTLIIGSKNKLTAAENVPAMRRAYAEVIHELKPKFNTVSAVLGENTYLLEPIKIDFSIDESSSLLLLGSDKNISSSLCVSVGLSLINQGIKTHMFNGDRSYSISDDGDRVEHPFMYVCNNLVNACAKTHKTNEIANILSELYSEYLRREKLYNDESEECETFEPIITIINDAYAINAIKNNDAVVSQNKKNSSIINTMTQNDAKEESDEASMFDILKNMDSADKDEDSINMDVFNDFGRQVQNLSDLQGFSFKSSVQEVLKKLLLEGYRVNMFVIMSIKGGDDYSISAIIPEIKNLVLFNETQYAQYVGNSMFAKEMLSNISNAPQDESMAVLVSKK